MSRARAILEPLADVGEHTCPCGARASKQLIIPNVWGGPMTFVYCRWCAADALEHATRLIEPGEVSPKRDRLRHPGKKVASYGSNAPSNRKAAPW